MMAAKLDPGIPRVPFAFIGWLRQHGIPIACEWDDRGDGVPRLSGLKIGSQRKRLPDAAYDVISDRYEDIVAVVSELKVPCEAKVPDCVFLKRRKDGIKGIWFDAAGGRNAKVWRPHKWRR